MSNCSASCFEMSSAASFYGVPKMLWEACLRLEDTDLWEVLAGPKESWLFGRMGWSENTRRQGSKPHRWEEQDHAL